MMRSRAVTPQPSSWNGKCCENHSICTMRYFSKNILLSALLVATAILLSSPQVVSGARQLNAVKKTPFRPRAVLGKKKAEPTKSAPAAVATPSTLTNALAGGLVFALIEKATKVGLAKADIQFPAMLGGCIFLFVFLILTNAVSPSAAASIYDALSPGAALLAKWIAPFFVPGLVILPLSPSVGGTVEVGSLDG